MSKLPQKQPTGPSKGPTGPPKNPIAAGNNKPDPKHLPQASKYTLFYQEINS